MRKVVSSQDAVDVMAAIGALESDLQKQVLASEVYATFPAFNLRKVVVATKQDDSKKEAVLNSLNIVLTALVAAGNILVRAQECTSLQPAGLDGSMPSPAAAVQQHVGNPTQFDSSKLKSCGCSFHGLRPEANCPACRMSLAATTHATVTVKQRQFPGTRREEDKSTTIRALTIAAELHLRTLPLLNFSKLLSDVTVFLLTQSVSLIEEHSSHCGVRGSVHQLLGSGSDQCLPCLSSQVILKLVDIWVRMHCVYSRLLGAPGASSSALGYEPSRSFVSGWCSRQPELSTRLVERLFDPDTFQVLWVSPAGPNRILSFEGGILPHLIAQLWECGLFSTQTIEALSIRLWEHSLRQLNSGALKVMKDSAPLHDPAQITYALRQALLSLFHLLSRRNKDVPNPLQLLFHTLHVLPP